LWSNYTILQSPNHPKNQITQNTPSVSNGRVFISLTGLLANLDNSSSSSSTQLQPFRSLTALFWVWIWVVGTRQGPWLGHHTDGWIC